MTSLNKFKIPTLLGLSIIFIGIVSGVFLVLREQSIVSQASPDLTPQNIEVTNITDSSVTISWQTNEPASSFINVGRDSPSGQTILDDRDNSSPAPRLIHYVTVKNLEADTSYQYKIFSSKISTDVFKFQTAPQAAAQNGFQPVIGSVLEEDLPLKDGVAYLSIAGASAQSTLIKSLGNFVIPISQMRKEDLSDIYTPSQDSSAKITIISEKDQATALFNLSNAQDLPAIKLGDKLDFTTLPPSPTPSPQELITYDLNDDGQINANDHAIILQNFGRNPKEKRADLNSDGVVDQKDLDLMAEKVREGGGAI